MKKFYYSEKIADLMARAQLFSQIVEDSDISNLPKLSQLCKNIGFETNTRFTIIDTNGIVLCDSDKAYYLMDNHSTRPEIVEAYNNIIGTSIRYSNSINKEMMYLAYPVEITNQKVIIRTSLPITDLQAKINDLYFRLFVIMIILTIIALLLCYFIAKKISNPIKSIEYSANRFSKGKFDYIYPKFNISEIDSLAKTLNTMADDSNRKIEILSRIKNEQDAVLGSMVEAVIAVDLEGNIIIINPAAENLFQITADSIGLSIFNKIRNTKLSKYLNDLLKKDIEIELEIQINIKKKDLNAKGVSLIDKEKNIIGALIVFHDVTKTVKLESIRKEFVSNVSHELKTPITTIKGSVETLLEFEQKSQSTNFLNIINNNTNRLNSIIDDLLLLSKIEEHDGKKDALNIEINNQFLKPVIESALIINQNLQNDKSINIEIDCFDEIKLPLNATLMEEALSNLLNNSIKYSPKNSTIKVNVNKIEKNIIIYIIDEGIGIDSKHIERLFERFYRVDESRSREAGGTGLGLSIVKHIINLHKGKVEVTSELDKGSQFIITLPR